MTPAFKTAIEIILPYEGLYSNDPNDSGGETNYGISKKAYPNLDIKALTRDEAKAIYYKDYWQKVRGDKLPLSVSIVMLDIAINMGAATAVKLLQDIVGTKRDGVFGDLTLTAAQRLARAFIVEELTIKRIVYYASLKGFPNYGNGWTRRSIEICSTALLLRENMV